MRIVMENFFERKSKRTRKNEIDNYLAIQFHYYIKLGIERKFYYFWAMRNMFKLKEHEEHSKNEEKNQNESKFEPFRSSLAFSLCFLR